VRRESPEKRRHRAPRSKSGSLSGARVDERCRICPAIGLTEHGHMDDGSCSSRGSSPRLGPLSCHSRAPPSDVGGPLRGFGRRPAEPAGERRSRDGIQDNASESHRRTSAPRRFLESGGLVEQRRCQGRSMENREVERAWLAAARGARVPDGALAPLCGGPHRMANG
jgi:hypothetical protein